MARPPRNRANEDATAYARCRTLGHSWDPIPVTDPPPYGAALDLRCEHCHTVRRDIVSLTTGYLYSRRYSYPDHYRDESARVRQDWRAMWVTTLADTLRSLGEDPEPPQPAYRPSVPTLPPAATNLTPDRESRRRSA